MAVRRILYGIALIGCGVFYFMYQKWFAWIVLLAMVFLPWFSLLCSLPAMLLTKLQITVPEQVKQGEEAALRLRIRCPVPKPPVRYRIRITKPNTGETLILRRGTKLPVEHCGGILVHPERVYVYDYLGLFRRRIRKMPDCILRVLPKPMEIPMEDGLGGAIPKAWRKKKIGSTAENHEMRPYQQGDNLTLVHWKLSAKVDELMVREPMEPDQGRMLLLLDINGTAEELDRKYARLLWMGNRLLQSEVSFKVIPLTGNGIETWHISAEWMLERCLNDLLCTPFAPEGSVKDRKQSAAWQYTVGGEPDEA